MNHEKETAFPMDAFKEFAIKIAHEAGALLKDRFGRGHQVHHKGAIDLVTETDRLSEDLLKSRIHGTYPDHGILAEESDEIETRSEYRWILDPLDGTTNYAHGFPVFCVSIALEKNGDIVLGVVFNPMMNETFMAQRDEGAFLNAARLSVSKTASVSESLFATGFPYDIREKRDNNLNYFAAMATRAQAIRRCGSAALDLAYTAAGRFDGFWELRLKPWDTAAAALMVCEAGGVIADIHGDEHRFDSPGIVASNDRIHEEMISIFKRTDPLF
jgi:myo-inositol-1(or 4)-monophosphatase